MDEMSDAAHEPDGTEVLGTSDEEVNRLRHRLFDVASELRPLSSFEELEARITHVRGELSSIEQELQLTLHVARLEEGDILAQVESIERRLAEGWVPDAEPISDVIAEFRTKYGS